MIPPVPLPAGLLVALALLLAVPGSMHARGGVFTQTRHADPATGAFRTTDWGRGDCGQCHTAHGGSTPSAFALFAPNTNGLCYTSGCHQSSSANGIYPGPAAYDGSSHATRSGMVWPGADATVDAAAPRARPPGDWGKCVNCHDVHGYNVDGSGLIASLAVSREDRLCVVCHDGSPAAKSVKAEIAKAYRHPVATSGRHRAAEGGNAAAYAATPTNNRHAECVDCHNPHVAAADPTPAAAPGVSKRLWGVGRVVVANGAAGTTPTYTYRAPGDVAVPTFEWEICFKCHSSWTAQPSGQTDLAVSFNSNNASYHPVEAVGKNTGINVNAFVAGWTPTARMFCTDCHTSDNAAVRGPHGSAYQYILKKSTVRSSAQRTMSPSELCFDCHRYDTYANDGASSTIKAYSRFNPPQRSQGHTYHVGSRRYPCYACHDSHGSATRPGLIVTGRNPGLNGYTQTSGGGTCSPTCHGSESYSINYPR